MGKILVITGAYFTEHAAKDLGVVRELRRRGHEVTHLIVARDIPPPFPRQVIEQVPDFRETGSLWTERLSGAVPHLPRCEVLLLPGHKGVEQLSEWARRLGKVVVQHQNHGGFDSYNAGAHLTAAKGPFFADYMIEKWGLRADTVISTGCVQYDAAFRPEAAQFSRAEFCRIYALDPAKRIAVWLPTREDRQERYYEWSVEQYRRVCQIVAASPNHSLMIKPHPADVPDPYRPASAGPHWWDRLAPGVPVVRPEHGYACFWLCDVALANWSSTGLEFPLFRHPFIYVDVADNPRIHYLKQQPNLAQPIGFYRDTLVPGFVGHVCTSAELPEILASCSYDTVDPGEYDAHIARFLTKADGKAYERVADVVERGLALSAAQAHRAPPGALAGVYASAWLGKARRRLRDLLGASRTPAAPPGRGLQASR